MGWYAASGLWRRRAAISVDIAAATPVDVNITIPPEWDLFWTTIDASANNVTPKIVAISSAKPDCFFARVCDAA